MPPQPTSTIEVCQGPDCFGSGGGAAILEIEELVQEYNSNVAADTCTTTVVRGGCRDFCSMGPNVHYRGQHYCKVASATECQELMKEASECSTTTTAVALPITTKLLLRQADRQRWQALRLVARIQKSPTKVSTQQIELTNTKLEEALATEKKAVQNVTSIGVERAQRRSHRLMKSLQGIAQENADLSDESEEEDNDT